MAWAPMKYTVPLGQSASPEAAPQPAGFSRPGTGDIEKTKHLLGVCGKVLDGTNELIEFVDKNRKMARQIGIETIAIELSGLVDGARLGDVRNVLAQGVKSAQAIALSPDIVTRLGRAEMLLSEASSEIAKEGVKPEPSVQKTGSQMGQDSGVGYFWVPFVALGVAAIGIAIYAYHSNSRPVAEMTPLPKAAPKIGSRVFLGSKHRK